MAIKPGLRIHMIGIGGAGMSGIAKVLAERGFIVSGSDLHENEVTKRLESLGIRVFRGHVAENLKTEVDWVVISTAITKENVELKAALDHGIPVIRRGEMLAELVGDMQALAVSGAHGKTTTTAMIFTILEGCNYDPTFVVGGELRESSLNAKNGNGEYAVIEADESDASFLALNPHIAVVTNVEDDHLDFYKTRDKIEGAFLEFLGKIKPNGYAILCGEDPFLRNLSKYDIDTEKEKFVLYGESEDFEYYFKDWVPKKMGSEFSFYHQGEMLGKVVLQVPGKHNSLNAMAAIITALKVGISFGDAAFAISKFTGTKRRFQIVGERNKIVIVDDYAHHPTEIKATIKAARDFHDGRIIVVFQPHRYSRTRDLGKELGMALSLADIKFVTNVYSAGEECIPGITGKIVAEAAGKDNSCFFIESNDDILQRLHEIIKTNDLIITMGAGDVWKIGEELLRTINVS